MVDECRFAIGGWTWFCKVGELRGSVGVKMREAVLLSPIVDEDARGAGVGQQSSSSSSIGVGMDIGDDDACGCGSVLCGVRGAAGGCDIAAQLLPSEGEKTNRAASRFTREPGLVRPDQTETVFELTK